MSRWLFTVDMVDTTPPDAEWRTFTPGEKHAYWCGLPIPYRVARWWVTRNR